MSDWLLDPQIAYLNHGAFGALPTVVAETADELRARMERNPFGLLARELPAQLDDVRGRVAALLRADDSGCVFVPNATTGTATVLAALAPAFGGGDELVTTDHRYGAVLAQLRRLESTIGTTSTIAHVPLTLRTAEQVTTAVVERLSPRTRLLIVDAVASLSGFVFPVQEIVAAAHDRGVPVLVDAAHAPGQIDVDLGALDADFWVGNLHKWVCCPRPAAVLYVAPQWREVMRPLVASHDFAEGLQPAFDWTGTFDPVPLLTVPAALDFWEAMGWEAMRSTQRGLVERGAAQVAGALGTDVPVSPEFAGAMRIIRLPEPLSESGARAVEQALATDHRIEVSLMRLHEQTFVRVCGQVYNTPDDYERLATALPQVLEGPG